MVNYQCPMCCKEFHKKYNFEKHTLNKKKPCHSKPQIPPIPPNDNPNIPQEPPITPQGLKNIKATKQEVIQMTINDTLKNDKDTQKEDNKILHSCTYCGTCFTRKDHLKRHLDKRCKVKILDNEHKEKTFELLIKEKDNEIIDIKKKLEQLEKQMETQLNKVQTQNINKGNITNNNIIIPQAKLTDFGSEDYEKINLKRILNSIKDSGVNGIINCFNDIHYNEEIPQYKNVFITDKSRDKGMIFENGQWKVKSIKYIVGEIMTHIERYVRIIEKRIRQGKYKDVIDPEDPEKKKKLNIKEFKETMESRLKKYILRYYGDDEETTPKDSTKFYNMVIKNMSNHLFDIKDKIYRHYEKVLEDINKETSDDKDDPDIKEIKEEKNQIIKELDKLKDKIKNDSENKSVKNNLDDSDYIESDSSELSDSESDNKKIKDNNKKLNAKEPAYIQKTITLASGLKKQVWIDANANLDDYYNF